MAKARILVASDDPEGRKALGEALQAEGWAVLEAEESAPLLDRFDAGAFDLAALDIDGEPDALLALAQDLRGRRNVPIVVISDHATPLDRVRLLEAGADDFVAKPFLIRELVLRIRKVLWLYGHEVDESEPLVFDHSAFDFKRRLVKHLDGTPIDLTETELKLLELFIRHPGRILSRDDISQALYGREWSPYDRTIDGHVARLRRKVAPVDEDGQDLIRSVRGVGYVFSGDVKPSRELV